MTKRGGLASGKREMEDYMLSPNIDPDGDDIQETLEGGLIWKIKGPDKERSYEPLKENLITIVKGTVLIIGITVGALGMWYGTFGCITQYIMKNYTWVTQFTLFLVLFFNIFIVMAESNSNITPPWVSFVMAFLTWVFFNICTKVGDTWAFYNIPFWPGPMTWWGIIMIVCLFIYFIDNMRQYWEKTNVGVYTEKNKTSVKFYTRVEIISIIIVLVTIVVRFIIEIVNEKNNLKGKFNFISFFLGLDTIGKVRKQGNTNNLFKISGKCRDDYIKDIDKQLKNGIKNSYWTKAKEKINKILTKY